MYPSCMLCLSIEQIYKDLGLRPTAYSYVIAKGLKLRLYAMKQLIKRHQVNTWCQEFGFLSLLDIAFLVLYKNWGEGRTWSHKLYLQPMEALAKFTKART